MRIVKINDRFSIATQPDLTEFGDISGLGFAAVVNNRPEGEEPGQPSSSEEAQAAQVASLGYTHIPVTGPTLSEADAKGLQAALAAADGPVLAHCKSGMRSLMLFAIGEVLEGRMKVEDVVGFGAKFGIDLRPAEAWLRRNGR